LYRAEKGKDGEGEGSSYGDHVEEGKKGPLTWGVRLEREEVAPRPCFIDAGRPAWVGPKSTGTFSNSLK
jgi:hypothetical protein